MPSTPSKTERAKNTDLAAFSRRPTLKTIAGLTGLAVTTVSRALNDAPDIGLKTRQRVRQVADEVGYVPNRAGVRLRTGRTSVISLVLCTDQDAMNHTAKLISAISTALRDTHYHLIITPYFLDEDPMRPIRYIVENRSADAVVLNRIQPNDPRIGYLKAHKIPFVTHGRSGKSESTGKVDDHSYFDFDNETFGAIGVRKLVARGRKNLLMIAPPLTQNYAQHMTSGAQQAANELGVNFQVLHSATSDDTNTHVHQAVREHCEQNRDIDGLMCGSMTCAMAAVAAVETLNLCVGEDLDVLAKEAAAFLSLFRPEILTVREDIGRAGKFLAEAAIKAINDPGGPPLQGLEVPTIND